MARFLQAMVVALLLLAGQPMAAQAQDDETTTTTQTDEIEFDEFDEFDEGEFDGEPYDPEQERAELETILDLPLRCNRPPDLLNGIGIDCAVRILPTENQHDRIFSAVMVDQLEREDFELQALANRTCDIVPGGVPDFFGAQPAIVCRNVGSLLNDLDRQFNLHVNGLDFGPALTLNTQFSTRFSSIFGRDSSLVSTDRPLVLDVFEAPADRDAESGAHIIIEPRQGGAESKRITLTPDPGSRFDTSYVSSIDVDLPPGLYRWWPCFGPELATCERDAGGIGFQVMDLSVKPLFADYNTDNDDRINVLFMGSGLGNAEWEDGFESLPLMARTILTVDGTPIAEDFDGDVYNLAWGPFSIEPLRSNLHKFNFWYVEGDLFDESSVLSDPGSRDYHRGFDTDALPNLHIAVLYYSNNRSRSDARVPTFVENGGAVPRDRRDILFGDTRVWVAPFLVSDAATTLGHEWGHALFGLWDEYTNVEFDVNTRGPNCAPDLATAEMLWGDKFGALDPFWVEVEATYATYDLDATESLTFGYDGLDDAIEIGPTPGGCYALDGDNVAYRPSGESLMGNNIPIFGAVNRSIVEEVLSRFPAAEAEPPPATTTTTSPPPPTTAAPTTTTTAPSSTSGSSTEIAAPDNDSNPTGGTGTGPLVPVIVGLLLLVAGGVYLRSRTGSTSLE